MLCEEHSLNIFPDKNVRSEMPNRFNCVADKGTFASCHSGSFSEVAKILARTSESEYVGVRDIRRCDLFDRSDVSCMGKIVFKVGDGVFVYFREIGLFDGISGLLESFRETSDTRK